MNENYLRQLLTESYDFNKWHSVFSFVFPDCSFEKNAIAIEHSSDKVSYIHQKGDITLPDKKKIIILEIGIQKGDISKAKVGFHKITSKFIDQSNNHAILAFYVPNSTEKSDYRLSFIAKESKFNEEGAIENVVTNPKRYTYVLGQNHSCTTAAKRLNELASKRKNQDFGIKDITDAFSVSTLTKEFYAELFNWYQWILSEDVGVTFPKNTNISEDDREKLEEQIIRLITRLLFVWFIKQKQIVPDNLFDVNELKNILSDFDPLSYSQGNYYNAILQNLFFATLNKAVGERDFAREQPDREIKTLYRYAEMFDLTENEILKIFSPIPFLNGGLFECLDKVDLQGNNYFLDGFSRNDSKLNGRFQHRAFIPNCIFFDEVKGIIPLLKRYNFTVEEHAPEDLQVALDPELLGNVFENLLGAFNNETKESARKQSGSFYTPREIVDFMVSESLIAYLHKHLDLSKDTLQKLFAQKELPLELKNDEPRCKKISDKLKEVKIIDPACGSGAFPMGILKKMVEVLEKLDLHNAKTVYDQKLHLIEECIYGVDIQTIAAQISKLRFFISLIVEQETVDFSKPKENYGVITLPNLETKFVAANTLIALHKRPAQFELFIDPEIDRVKQEILSIRHEHFYAKTAKNKKELRERDESLRQKLINLLEVNGDFAPQDAKQLVLWNPYDQNSSAPFFDNEWMFGIKGGFDIVIGNPPYIQLQKNNGKLAKEFENRGFKTFERTGDIYSLFYEKGIELLKPNGHLIFITSNKWMRSGYGHSTRKFFAENTNPILLIDFAGKKIFESATVDTNILLLSKEKNLQKTKACSVKELALKNLSVFVNQHEYNSSYNNADSWVILSDIEKQIKEKIERIGTPLKKWDLQINYGIKTGYNDAFIINGNKRKELIEQDPKSEEIIRPILRGRDIKRYSYEFADLWLLYIPWHFPLHEDKTITGASEIAESAFKSIYPAIYKHLLQHKSELENRNKAETGIRYEWYALQRWGANYWDDFSKQKIVWGNLNLKASFAIAPEGFFVNAPCPMIVPANLYILAILNSKIADYYIRSLGVTRNGGYFEYKPMFIEQLPVPIISEFEQRKYDFLLKKNSLIENEKLIEKTIYQLYELNDQEISFIESSENQLL